jgi:uncharacterized protein (TIGR00251 family)
MIFKETDGAVTFAVKVIPRASRTEIVGIEGDAVKVRLSAPPVEGRANVALVELLAKTLAVSPAQIDIVRGETARRKLVRVRGVVAEYVKRTIEKTVG